MPVIVAGSGLTLQANVLAMHFVPPTTRVLTGRA